MHTKGPWTIKGQDIYGDDEYICKWSGRTANARLIAAAPELLEALELAYGELDSRMLANNPILIAVDKAIRKTKGE